MVLNSLLLRFWWGQEHEFGKWEIPINPIAGYKIHPPAGKFITSYFALSDGRNHLGAYEKFGWIHDVWCGSIGA